MQLKKVLAFVLMAIAAQGASAVDLSSHYGAVLGKYVFPDTLRDADYGVGAHLVYGVPLTSDLDLEINGFSYLTERETSSADDYGYGLGLDLRYALADSRNFGLFFLIGVGGLYEDIGTENGTSPYGDAGFSLNFWNIFNIPNLSLRADARHYLVVREESSGFTINSPFVADNLGDTHVNIGLQLDFGNTAAPAQSGGPQLRDTDDDGVIDPRDECANTPVGSVIDGRGCPLQASGDADGDGVNDNADKCPGTPPATTVDLAGCPLASAAQLPVAVLDSDADGVADALDACPGTPPGSQVDARGCPLPRDLDGDGVPNEIDMCPNTPLTMKVDVRGCVVKQTVVFNNINFQTGSDQLTPSARAILDTIATGLRGQPGMMVEISGHTDAQGAQDYNLKLSQNRARSVKSYLMGKSIGPGRMTTAGYGEFNPVAGNDTESGRAKNRRVEFKITKQ